MQTERAGGDVAQTGWPSALRQFAMRGFLLCVLLFGLEALIFVVVSSLPYFPGEQAAYTQQAHQLSSQVSGASYPALIYQIFTNNFRIALLEMIPIFGVILFALSIYETARVTEAIAGINSESPLLLVILLLVIFPHSWIELPAYAVATAEGLYLLYALAKAFRGDRRRLSMEAAQLGINIIIVAAMLIVAAIFESTEIELGGYFWITWIPFALVLYLVLQLNGKLSKIRRDEKTGSVVTTEPMAPVLPPEQPPAS